MGKLTLTLIANYKHLILTHVPTESASGRHIFVCRHSGDETPWDVHRAWRRMYNNVKTASRHQVLKLSGMMGMRPGVEICQRNTRTTIADPSRASASTATSNHYRSLTDSSDTLRGIVLGAVGTSGRALMTLGNKTTVVGKHHLEGLLNRAPGTPAITVSNHVTALDDPLLLAASVPAVFDFTRQANDVRWTLCATDRCFKYELLSPLFRAAKVIPVERGAGIDQAGMQAATDRLRAGDWVHIFPEGTRNKKSGSVRTFRPGIGHLVTSLAIPTYNSSDTTCSHTSPNAAHIPPQRQNAMILPFVHSGMEGIFPKRSWVPRLGNSVTVMFGAPISTGDLLDRAVTESWSRSTLDKEITRRVETHVRKLQVELESHLLGETCAGGVDSAVSVQGGGVADHMNDVGGADKEMGQLMFASYAAPHRQNLEAYWTQPMTIACHVVKESLVVGARGCMTDVEDVSQVCEHWHEDVRIGGSECGHILQSAVSSVTVQAGDAMDAFRQYRKECCDATIELFGPPVGRSVTGWEMVQLHSTLSM